MKQINNFIVLDSIYGYFIVNRHCSYQAEALAKTGQTHIENELRNIIAIIDTLPKDCIIVDGGANIGFVTIPVAQKIKNKNGKVYAFEPQKMIFNALAGSIALNDLENVILQNIGLSDKESYALLPIVNYNKPADFGMVSLLDEKDITPNENDTEIKEREVKIIALDSLKLPRLDFLKLDVEGFEIQALEGSIDTIKKYRPWLWIECWIVGEESIKKTLTEVSNYEFIRIDKLNLLAIPNEKLIASGLKIQKN